MRFKFEPNLDFQREAIDAVSDLFKGAPKTNGVQTLFGTVSPNILQLSDEQLKLNKQAVFEKNKIADPCASDDVDYSIEMETGTGKTYVYLRTIVKLYQQYGLCKFIIITPNIAVKEGVMQALRDAEQHFFELFNVRPNYFSYQSKKALQQIKNFAESGDLTIMVTNTQAFVGDKAIINSTSRDDTGGEKLSDLLALVRPIVILDEPQVGMDAAKTGQAIASLNPLVKLRYSATHKIVKNLVYQLTPYDAYDKGLVKKIEVLSVVGDGLQSSAHFVFLDIKSGNFAPQAKVELLVKQAEGFKLKTLHVSDGDNLAAKTNNSMYDGWIVDSVTGGMSGGWMVRITNGKEFEIGQKESSDKAALFREQIRQTVKKHFEKKKKLEPLGIKVLSLFFIDKVDNFIHQDSLIRQIFESEVYESEYIAAYGKLPRLSGAQAHTSYFARTSNGEYTDNKLSIEKNKDAYDEILRDKKALLALNNPREFIFSHSALGVGWDNPNVFNICTLNESENIAKKRQEIGRGLRICVNTDGDRVHDSADTTAGHEINLLTVIANQSYEAFVTDYQTELANDYGQDIAGKSRPRDAKRTLRIISRKDNVFTSADFNELWSKINTKTQCSVYFDEHELIARCSTSLNDLYIQKPILRLGLNQITSINDGVAHSNYKGSDVVSGRGATVRINIVNELSEATALSYNTITAIFDNLQNLSSVVLNPSDFIQKASIAINKVLESQLVRFVTYKPITDTYDADAIFKPTQTNYDEPVMVARGLYDGFFTDSDQEKLFANELDSKAQVKFFAKLPSAYKIPMPNGSTYNPDWAMMIQKSSMGGDDGAKHYFVVETKGKANLQDLSPDEQFKINCAIKHFEALGLNQFIAPVKPNANFAQLVNQKVADLL